jgi:hypothetical protein
MQAVAAEFSGCAEKFYCFLERRVFDEPSTQELENSRRTNSLAPRPIAAFLHSSILEYSSS